MNMIFQSLYILTTDQILKLVKCVLIMDLHL